MIRQLMMSILSDKLLQKVVGYLISAEYLAVLEDMQWFFRKIG